jgi:hypothetical protein
VSVKAGEVQVVLLSALAALAVAASLAGATSYNYCSTVLGPFDHCDGARHSLTANQAHDDFGADRVCAGAVDTSGSFYGSYACGYGFAEHCYSGANLLYPRLHNGESFSQQMHGTGFYSENCP